MFQRDFLGHLKAQLRSLRKRSIILMGGLRILTSVLRFEQLWKVVSLNGRQIGSIGRV